MMLPSVASLLTLSSVILLISAQDGYDLTYTRPDPLDNVIIMECRTTPLNRLLLEDADFFRNGVLYELPGRSNIDGRGVGFVIDRSSEGNFACGQQGNSTVITSFPLTIVGKIPSVM